MRNVTTMSLRSEKVIRLLTYMGKMTAKIKMEDVPSRTELNWVVDAVINNKEKIQMININKDKKKFLNGTALILTVHAASEELEGI